MLRHIAALRRVLAAYRAEQFCCRAAGRKVNRRRSRLIRDRTKMSKSLDNFIPPSVLVDRYGVDAVRYFMIRDLPFGTDGNLSETALHRRVTGSLAN